MHDTLPFNWNATHDSTSKVSIMGKKTIPVTFLDTLLKASAKFLKTDTVTLQYFIYGFLFVVVRVILEF
jgi:hypothetical protein